MPGAILPKKRKPSRCTEATETETRPSATATTDESKTSASSNKEKGGNKTENGTIIAKCSDDKPQSVDSSAAKTTTETATTTIIKSPPPSGGAPSRTTQPSSLLASSSSSMAAPVRKNSRDDTTKRKLVFDASALARKNSQDLTIPSNRKASLDSAETHSSNASEDTTSLALKVLMTDLPSPQSQPQLPLSKPPPKKRKASFDLPLSENSTSTGNLPPRKRKASFDTRSTSEPRKQRLLSFDVPFRRRKSSSWGDYSSGGSRQRCASIGSIDDAALGLVPLGSVASVASEVIPPIPDTTTSLTGGGGLPSSTALDHLDALGDEASLSSRAKLKGEEDDQHSGGSGNTMASGNQRLLIEALMMSSTRRARFESWGGMSDISINHESSAAAALAASALHSTGILDDVTAAAHSCAGSVASSVSTESKKVGATERKISEGSGDIQAFVAAAMATVGDQLAELAGVVETVAEGSVCSEPFLKDAAAAGRDGETSIVSGGGSLPEINDDAMVVRPRSMSTISVDVEAIMAAVDAGDAAIAALDLTAIASMKPPACDTPKNSNRGSRAAAAHVPPIPPLPPSSKSERDMEAIRAKARAAAGYIPPSKPGEVPSQPVAKKKTKPPVKTVYSTPARVPPAPDAVFSASRSTPSSFIPPTPGSMVSMGSKASSQKWDDMFDCLVLFIEERRREETKTLSEQGKSTWEWDGNVPTTYKTKDGKALGRWINNQRSAKHKGSLKKEREAKLVSTGLKWSVLSTNSWQDMMNELKLYVKEKTKDGQPWDGNVPTNYKIKGIAGENGGEAEDDKNLGRWINRQRSLYQSGKLRKDRQAELEKIGLKWSVLATTSWQSMYDSLVEYVRERRAADPKGEWDGNVPANHRTSDNPPKALGRWINRQRSSYTKNKLKKEFVDKLNAIGLKWAVHERRLVHVPSVPMSVRSGASYPTTPAQGSVARAAKTPLSALKSPATPSIRSYGTASTPMSVLSSTTAATTTTVTRTAAAAASSTPPKMISVTAKPPSSAELVNGLMNGMKRQNLSTSRPIGVAGASVARTPVIKSEVVRTTTMTITNGQKAASATPSKDLAGSKSDSKKADPTSTAEKDVSSSGTKQLLGQAKTDPKMPSTPLKSVPEKVAASIGQASKKSDSSKPLPKPAPVITAAKKSAPDCSAPAEVSQTPCSKAVGPGATACSKQPAVSVTKSSSQSVPSSSPRPPSVQPPALAASAQPAAAGRVTKGVVAGKATKSAQPAVGAQITKGAVAGKRTAQSPRGSKVFSSLKPPSNSVVLGVRDKEETVQRKPINSDSGSVTNATHASNKVTNAVSSFETARVTRRSLRNAVKS